MSLVYDKVYTLKTYDETFEKARSIFQENDLNMAQAINRFLKQVAMTGEVDLLDEKELLFKQLQSEVKKAVDDFEAGKGISLSKVREELGL